MKTRDLIALSAVLIFDQVVKAIFIREGLTFQNNRLGLVLPAAALIFLALTSTRYKEKQMSLALALIIGGGASNLIDLFAHNGVVDYLFAKNLYFNIADIAILSGVLLIISQAGTSIKKNISATRAFKAK